MPSCLRASDQRGFSLVEIMFAVIIMGIGFIMVAAIFPVAISQSRTTVQETTAAAVARGAFNTLAQVALGADSVTNYPMRATGDATIPVGLVQQLTPEMWSAIKGNLILPSDPRYAWVGLYKRDGDGSNPTDPAKRRTWAPTAQVWLIPVEVRNRSIYEPKSGAGEDLHDPGPTAPGSLTPIQVAVEVVDDADGTGVDTITFHDAGIVPGQNPPARVAEGTYVVISDDNISAPPADQTLRPLVGRIFRVGVRRADLDGFGWHLPGPTWEVAPAYEFGIQPGANAKLGDPQNPKQNPDDDDILGIGNSTSIAPNGKGATFNGPVPAYIVGRNTTPTLGAYEGPAQDLGIFTTFIRVN
ncbi:MAG: type IV pilus modification PilV family protein [Tepidisphaeraceae bacterium]